jgi:hypothetical protein
LDAWYRSQMGAYDQKTETGGQTRVPAREDYLGPIAVTYAAAERAGSIHPIDRQLA